MLTKIGALWVDLQTFGWLGETDPKYAIAIRQKLTGSFLGAYQEDNTFKIDYQDNRPIFIFPDSEPKVFTFTTKKDMWVKFAKILVEEKITTLGECSKEVGVSQLDRRVEHAWEEGIPWFSKRLNELVHFAPTTE